jgi:hypothetical protein
VLESDFEIFVLQINTFAPTLATALSAYSLIYNQPQLQPFIAALTALSQRLQFSDYAFLSIIQYAKREAAYMSDSAVRAKFPSSPFFIFFVM